ADDAVLRRTVGHRRLPRLLGQLHARVALMHRRALPEVRQPKQLVDVIGEPTGIGAIALVGEALAVAQQRLVHGAGSTQVVGGIPAPQGFLALLQLELVAGIGLDPLAQGVLVAAPAVPGDALYLADRTRAGIA